MDIDPVDIERKWQSRWEGAFSPRTDRRRKKFFIIFAYPGISGYLHVGHLRSYTYPDVIARFKRMTGYNVLFPAGFHASGLPAVSIARKVQRGDPEWLAYLRSNGCPEDVIPRLADPMFAVGFFSKEYLALWKRVGLSLDDSRCMTTIDPGYAAFIRWQFRRLDSHGLLVRRTHRAPACPNCGPVAVDPSETDISRGGNAEILEYSLIKFRCGDTVLPCATLRPETVYGVTNLWLNPEVDYVKVDVEGERWLVAREGLEKLGAQGVKVGPTHKVSGRELIGRKASNLVTGENVPILPGRFVQPTQGTGVVMSVPAHAPYDLAALRSLVPEEGLPRAEDIQPIPLIRVKGYGDIPAADILDRMGVTGISDQEALDEATHTLYREEYHSGTLRRERYGELAGLPVAEGKTRILAMLREKGLMRTLYEFSEDVICRCGERVRIRMVPDQWFISYSDARLKERAKMCVERMHIFPREYSEELLHVIDWYEDRACVRQGSWLGTEFPFAGEWTIEPISDSTLYPAYYIVAGYVNDGSLSPENLCDEVFDHVFLGLGDPKGVAEVSGVRPDILKKMREDFVYWYPLDMNCGGKEHKTVHFPVFVMNHVALLPEPGWPRGIFVNWWVVGEAGKISKSKGGAGSITDAVERYTADGLRLYYCHIASPRVDMIWNEDAVIAYRRRVELIYGSVLELVRDLSRPKRGDPRAGAWLRSMLAMRISSVRKAMETLELRTAANIIFYEMYNDLKRYLNRGGFGPELKTFLKNWSLLMCPFTPHLAEEIWHALGGRGFASLTPYPEAKDVDPLPVLEEEYLDALSRDIRAILGMYRGPRRRIEIFVCEKWKRDLLGEFATSKEFDPGRVIKRSLKDGLVPRERAGALADYVRSLRKYVLSLNDMQKEAAARVDEAALLKRVRSRLCAEFSCEVVVHSPEETAASTHPKARAARPLKPGIFVT